MLKRWSASVYMGLFALVLFGLGFYLRLRALVRPSFKVLLALAALTFVCALVCLLIWLWTSPFFRRNSAAYASTDRRSRKARERESTILKVLSAVVVVFFLLANQRIYSAYKTRTQVKVRGSLEVYLADSERMKARTIPFVARPDRSKDMLLAMSTVPIKTVNIQQGEQYKTIDVVLRNNSPTTVRNAHLRINSNVAIEAGSATLTPLSSTELDAPIINLTPFSQNAEERVFTVKIPIPGFITRAGLIVTVEGENFRPFEAVGRVVFNKDSEHKPSSTVQPAVGKPGQVPGK